MDVGGEEDVHVVEETLVADLVGFGGGVGWF